MGKGRGSRVQDHARGDRKKIKDPNAKLDLIREIRKTGEVIGIIHRYGLTDEVALEVEAALMDAYPGLTNSASGKGADRRAMTVDAFIRKYAAPVAKFDRREPCLAITINRALRETRRSVYDCARFAWKLSERRASAVRYVLAVHHGLIVAAFVPTRWKRAQDPPRKRRDQSAWHYLP